MRSGLNQLNQVSTFIKKEPISDPVPSAANEIVIASTIATPVPSTPPTVSSVP